MKEVGKYVKPYEPSFTTMMPTSFVVRMRTNILWQIIRFIIINIKMLIVLKKSH